MSADQSDVRCSANDELSGFAVTGARGFILVERHSRDTIEVRTWENTGLLVRRRVLGSRSHDMFRLMATLAGYRPTR